MANYCIIKGNAVTITRLIVEGCVKSRGVGERNLTLSKNNQ